MKPLKISALALLLAGGVTWNASARAQVNPPLISAGRGGTETTTSGPVRYGSVAIYPLAMFTLGGTFSNGTSGTQSQYGGLFAADFGFRKRGRVDAVEAGGWYWSEGHHNLYQVHGRYMFNPDIGIQGALLNTTRGAANVYTTFLVYNIDSRRIKANTRNPFGIQFGVGLLFDSANDKTTNDFSYFVNASVGVAKNISINATGWYLRDRNQDLNRVTLGLGYNF